MPLTTNGVYYPDGDTSLSLATITENVANSIDDKLGVIQIAYSSTKTVVTNSSNTVYGNTGLSVSIRPRSISNKLIVLAHVPFLAVANMSAPGHVGGDFLLRKTGLLNEVSYSSYGLVDFQTSSAGNVEFSGEYNIIHNDTITSTDEVTYSVQGKFAYTTYAQSSKTLSMNYSGGATTSTLIVMEVAQ